MEDHYCEYVIEWQRVETYFTDAPFREFSYNEPKNCCGKIARFQDDLGKWYCAQHWDELQATIDRLEEKWNEYDQGICKICNCEFHNGECNCQFYEFG